jgi:hypothetical protein
MWIYISTPPKHLHGVVLNQLRTGTPLPLHLRSQSLCNILSVEWIGFSELLVHVI